MVVLEEVSRTYQTKRGQVRALDGVSVRVERGEFVVLCGPSGSGKTTLLMTVAAMLRPSRGRVRVEERDIYAMSIRQRAIFRARNIGFVFQMFYLVPYLNVIENIVLAGGAAGAGAAPAEARELLGRLGLGERALHRPAELSAGEKQRVAIARAMFNRPKIILADEPTGNLDPDNASVVLEHLSEFHRGGGTVVLASHGPEALEFADRVVHLERGAIRDSG
ncbi:MAG: ABC transporter ATP-binding protein [Phycisphaerales bacterium]|nr:MAG: ABC transporter ATP-binding protein [Phycisphaerales bacterium]